MPSLGVDHLSALKKEYYDDLPDYERGWIDGTVQLAVVGGIAGIILFSCPKCNRQGHYPLVHKAFPSTAGVHLPGVIRGLLPLRWTRVSHRRAIIEGIRMRPDSKVLLPSWWRTYPSWWVKADQRGVLAVNRHTTLSYCVRLFNIHIHRARIGLVGRRSMAHFPRKIL